MDIFLIGVSVVSTVVALVMTVVAWRVSRSQRAASAARIAALSAAAAVDSDRAAEKPSHSTPLEQFETEPVAVSASRNGTQGTLGPQAPWVPARVSPFNSGARAAMTAARPDPHEITTKPAAIESATAGQALSEGFLGSAVSPPTDGGRQRSLALAAIVLFGLVLAGGYWAVFVNRSDTATVSYTEHNQSARAGVDATRASWNALGGDRSGAQSCSGRAGRPVGRGRLPLRSAGRLHQQRTRERRFLETDTRR